MTVDIDKLAREHVASVHREFPSAGGRITSYQFSPAQLTAYTRAVMDECAQKCEAQKYMVLDPLRSYSAEDMCLGKKDTAKYLAAAIREMMP